jgi:hypothetical protein
MQQSDQFAGANKRRSVNDMRAWLPSGVGQPSQFETQTSLPRKVRTHALVAEFLLRDVRRTEFRLDFRFVLFELAIKSGLPDPKNSRGG